MCNHDHDYTVSVRTDDLSLLSSRSISEVIGSVFDRCQRPVLNTSYGLLAETMMGYYKSSHHATNNHSRSIVAFLDANAEALTTQQVIAVLLAASDKFALTANGKDEEIKELVYTLLFDARSVEDSVDFMVNAVFNYLGKLPTVRMWKNLINLDRTDHVLGMSPTIAFAVSNTSIVEPDRQWINFVVNNYETITARGQSAG
jgi:hypothetical protein